MIDRAHIDRLIAEYASPFMTFRSGRDEETLEALRGLVDELRRFQRAYLDETHGDRDPATVTPDDVRGLREAFCEQCAMVAGLVNQLGVVSLGDVVPMVEAMRPVVEAAEGMRAGHEGCVVDPPCGCCFRCEFDRSVDAYCAWKERK